MGEKYEMISLAELSVLEITCKKCGMVLALKMNGEGWFPDQCPVCRDLPNGMSGRLIKALTEYRNFYREMSALELEARFRIKLMELK